MKPNRKLKKPQTSCSKLDLEEIIGLTVTNANGLASSKSDSKKFAYTAGCVVVVYDVDLGTQSHLMVLNRSPKPFSCVAVSLDGSYIAAGESGHQPATIVVWSSATLGSISELKGHQYGVACTAFSPDGKHLVSVGTPQDGYLCLWDWRSGTLVKKLKTCSPFSDVASVSFSADAKLIFTAGKKHIKIWTLGLPTKSRAKNETVSLKTHGKHVNLGHHKGCTFTDIASPIVDEKGGDSILVYALTSSGVLCVSHDGLKITQSVDLMVEKGYALSTSQEFIACACNNGIVKLYTIGSLEYAGSLNYSDDKENNTTENQLSTFPDAIACHFSTSEKLVVVYRDQSLYIWNIHGKFQATKCCVLVSHSECIWDIKNLPCENMHDPSLACIARGCTGGASFATCSADGTIRLWDFALQSVLSTQSRSTIVPGQHHVITEPLDTFAVGGGTFERESVISGVITKGYRSMAVSSDGKHLAAGDYEGNLHIFNLYPSEYKCIKDVHDGEILSLSFSSPVKNESYYLLASSGRDKMIHLFDVNRNFNLAASINDHSAAVSSVKLTANGRKIISCGFDRSLIFHDITGNDTDYKVSGPHQQKAFHGTIYDIAIDPYTETAVTVGQDKKINIFDIAVGKLIRSFKQGGEFGDPIKVCVDPSCSYVACSYSDMSICVYDFTTGEMVGRATGHGEAVNGVIFLPDCKHLVSVGSDGCIFVWKVPVVLTTRMLQRINENARPLSPAVSRMKFNEENNNNIRLQTSGTAVRFQGKCVHETPTFRFSVSRLPQWAKSKVTSPFVVPMDPIHSPTKSTSVENGPVNLLLHTPSNRNLRRLSDPTYSKESTTQGTCRSFALDKRWLTIHTVCLDLLNSPEAFSSDLPQSLALNPTCDNNACDVGQATCNITVDIKLNESELSTTSVNQVANDNSSNNSAISKHKVLLEPSNTFDACKEALRSLETSSKSALEVFSRLRDVATSTHENIPEASYQAQFYAEAAEILPSIAKNVNEIAKFASSFGVDNKVDIPGFEPLLGKFADSLSQRVIELLKESCTSSS